MSIDYAIKDWNGDAYDDESGFRFHELFFTDEKFEFEDDLSILSIDLYCSILKSSAHV